MDDLVEPLRAAGPLLGHLADVSPLPLAAALVFQVLKLGALSRVWLRILRVSYPGADLRGRDTVAPYLAGVGVNAVVPGKAGGLTRAIVARRILPGVTYETLAGTMAVEALLGVVPALGLIGAGFALGILPGATHGAHIAVPRLLAHPPVWLALGLAGGAALAALVLARARRARARALSALIELRRGLAILGRGRQLGRALLEQTAAWAFRIASIACFLVAFGIHVSPRTVLLVVIVQMLSALVPIAPNGAGAQQGLLVLALAGIASSGTILAFGIGMQTALALVDVLLGGLALASLGLRRVPLRGARAAAF